MLIPNPSCLCPRSFLESLKVNTEPLPGIEKTGKVKGLILTVKGESGGQTTPYDFYSRYFAPWFGVPEDPVTGTPPLTFLVVRVWAGYNQVLVVLLKELK